MTKLYCWLFIYGLFLFCTCCYGAVLAAKHGCSHDQYTIVLDNGTFVACRDCPPCVKGTGLVNQCGTEIVGTDDIDCKICPNGTYNDHELPIVMMCKPCNIQKNKEELKACTSQQNSEYGSCIKNFYFQEGEDRCVDCSCCTSDSHAEDRVKKCIDDGLPANMQCKNAGHLCPTSISTTLQTMNPAVQQMSSHSAPPTTEQSVVPDWNNESDIRAAQASSSSLSQETTIFVIVTGILLVIVPAVIIALAYWFVCKYRRSNRRTGCVDTELQEMHENPQEEHPLMNQSIEDIDQECRLSELDWPIRSYLEKKLDHDEPQKPNWFKVGQAFRVSDDDLSTIRLEYKKDAGSPTEALFSKFRTWGENEPYLKDLVRVLINLGRRDILDDWDWKDNKEK